MMRGKREILLLSPPPRIHPSDLLQVAFAFASS